MTIRRIRICRPFDKVCLQGGCTHCQDARATTPLAEVQLISAERGWLLDLEYGIQNGRWDR